MAAPKTSPATRTLHTADYLDLIGVRKLKPATSPFDPGYDPVTVESHLEQSHHMMSLLKISMACWLIADELVKLSDAPAPGAVILVLDASGHGATARDESFMLSAYLTHLAVVIGSLPQAGVARSLLWIVGQAAGAVYVAFAAPVQSVSAVSSAHIRILPEAAVQQILGADIVHSDAFADWKDSGVADALLDARLAVVH